MIRSGKTYTNVDGRTRHVTHVQHDGIIWYREGSSRLEYVCSGHQWVQWMQGERKPEARSEAREND